MKTTNKEITNRLNDYAMCEYACRTSCKWFELASKPNGAYIYAPEIDGDLSLDDCILEGPTGELISCTWDDALDMWGDIPRQDWEPLVALMDDEIREAIHQEMAPCLRLDFLAEYSRRHVEKFGEEFPPAQI